MTMRLVPRTKNHTEAKPSYRLHHQPLLPVLTLLADQVRASNITFLRNGSKNFVDMGVVEKYREKTEKWYSAFI